jgi:hypothetical protein
MTKSQATNDQAITNDGMTECLIEPIAKPPFYCKAGLTHQPAGLAFGIRKELYNGFIWSLQFGNWDF